MFYLELSSNTTKYANIQLNTLKATSSL